jgi:hypothetical protein
VRTPSSIVGSTCLDRSLPVPVFLIEVLVEGNHAQKQDASDYDVDHHSM